MSKKEDIYLIDPDVKIQKPMYFYLSQLSRIDGAVKEDRYPSRADFVRTTSDLFLELRDLYKSGEVTDNKIINAVEKYFIKFVNKRAK